MMNVTREVILDLLPVYLAGEASADTRRLVEEYLEQDPALAETVRREPALESLGQAAASPLPPPPPDVEVRSLRRTRSMIAWQRRLFGFGIGFTAIAATTKITFRQGRIDEVRFLIRDFPAQFGVAAVLAVVCWGGYFLLRRRLRTGTR